MQAVCRTNRGLVRENNEDRVLVKIPHLFAIADGMGGHQSGEIASYEAVKLLATLEFEGMPEEQILPYLQIKIENINKKIWEMGQANKKLSGMGTTLTALYLSDKNHAFVGHVGDSRIYLLQNNVLKQVTSDHSLVAEMVRQKKMTATQAENSAKKHLIMRAVGADPEVEVDTFEFLLGGARKILLCSDGLSNMVPLQQLQEIIREEDLNALADKLMQVALAAGGRDNISFIVVDVEG